MKNTLLPLLLLLATYSFGQSVIGSVNTGAVSNNNLVYTVGEIFVNPTSTPNEANSGLIGALSRIEFFVTGINEQLTSTDLRVFPNPTTGSVFFQSPDNDSFQQIMIYDQTGQLLIQQNKAASIDLSTLPKGMYTITTDNSKINSFKIVTQ